MEDKQRKFGAQSAKKRDEMSRMMKNEAYLLLEKLTKNDKVFQGIYLKRPFKETSESRLSKEKMLSRLSSERHDSKKYDDPRKKEAKSASFSTEATKTDSNNVKHILLTLIEKADFLVEDNLNTMMAALPHNDELLLKVDAILGSLGVEEEKDIDKMFDHLTLNMEHELVAGEKKSIASDAEKIIRESES